MLARVCACSRVRLLVRPCSCVLTRVCVWQEWKRSSHRNSSTVFCDEECYQREPAISVALARAEELTLMGKAHSELQFLHYEVKQHASRSARAAAALATLRTIRALAAPCNQC